MLRDHAFYLRLCYEYARNSPDPLTRNGAVLVDPATGDLVAWGWNRLPRGVAEMAARLDRPTKYNWVLSAVEAAVASAAVIGQMTYGLWLYCPWAADRKSARLIAECQIARLVRAEHPAFAAREDWVDSVAAGNVILAEAGVQVVNVPEPVGGDMLFDGRLIGV